MIILNAMGCAISYFNDHIIDLSKRSNISKNSKALIVAPHNLYRFLSEDNPNPKCIFIFGGPGSNKGQFIWEIMEQSCENYRNNQNNDLIKLLLIDNDDDDDDSDDGDDEINFDNNNVNNVDKKNKFENNNNNEIEIDLERFRFSYHYIDMERLIIDNIDDRIRKFTELPTMEQQQQQPISMNNFLTTTIIDDNSESLLDEINSLTISKRRKSESSQEEQLRLQLRQYANIITNSWILTLLKQEIEKQNQGPYENIFLVNIIPNRITLFRDCLFLQQTPSFINFDCNFVAIKLIRHSTRRKELEIKNTGNGGGRNNNNGNSSHDIDNNYAAYFRAINKLYEIRVKNAEDNIRLRLSTSNKTAICITNKQELITFIYMPKKDLLELNISGFQFNQHLNQILKQCRRQQTLLFIINKEIDLDDNIKLLINDHDKQQYDLVFLRKFIQLYRLTSYALKFV
ncbi:hypothetical protein DERP_013127 [Dermatophagoides pteronyssinus]|uniref:Uncharacterized protein n=1 Tax=Dermatophagoides pteronyssinus TaxID=6956 RepID=A0ABQ8J5V4_DERPT|nr:hypothetical protein DERP_013127 [Dermatophagoides pteronyssinus]